MTLFLRWIWLNVAAALIFAAGAVHYWSHLHGIALAVLSAILIRASAGSARGGRFCWLADRRPDMRPWVKARLEDLRTDAWECQMLAIMVTALGFYDVLTGSGNVIERVQHGAGAAVLLGTFTGVLTSLVLERTLRWLDREL